MTTQSQLDSERPTDVLVIGGGIAGLSCADHLGKLGLSAVVLEKQPAIGGQALNFFCKATDTCRKCNYCLVEERLTGVSENSGVEILTRAKLDQAEPLSGGGFAVTVRQEPLFIDPARCTNCGRCYEICPAAEGGAITRGLPSLVSHPLYTIHREQCLYFRDAQARICQEQCPEQAIDLDRSPLTHQFPVRAIVVATGYTPFNPLDKPRLGYGILPNVITALELERMIRLESELHRPSDRKRPARVAFIQCVGSRDLTLGHLFCSRICCGYALRMGRAIRHRWPETDLTVFYMDLQNFGKEFLPAYEEARETLTLVRGIPGAVGPAPEDRVAVVFQPEGGGAPREEVFDLLVLSVGLMPAPENRQWSERLDLPLTEDGFLRDQAGSGIFTAGTATGPMDIAQSAADGGRAARAVADYLGVRLC
ncbi:MAG: CoB--CoM heterodisulfide reductase iron-sulfur subunit A family protein [Deltaproteobacteria bacterium]|nr:CoB--CoM heterodisulfide reductase iron-sulfur subunit A family protein [Deltaproteobacteria bacterium]